MVETLVVGLRPRHDLGWRTVDPVAYERYKNEKTYKMDY
eukprot:COSAG06_NODE_5488_length_3446_cov_112.319390_2_plen_39_part_00